MYYRGFPQLLVRLLSVWTVLLKPASLAWPLSSAEFTRPLAPTTEGQTLERPLASDDFVGCSKTDKESSLFSASRRKILTRTSGVVAVALVGAMSGTGGGSHTANALSPQQARTEYDTYASTYDRLDGGGSAAALGIPEARAALVSQARGSVLEIGVETGGNLEHYNPQPRCIGWNVGTTQSTILPVFPVSSTIFHENL